MERYEVYRDSGIEWIGEIPRHWQIAKLKTIGSISKGTGIKRDDVVEDGFPCVRYGELYTTYSNKLEFVKSQIPASLYSKCNHLKPGELLFALTGETREDIGPCTMNCTEYEIAYGGDTAAFSVKYSDPAFLAYALNSEYFRKQKENAARGDIVVHLPVDKLLNATLVLPSPEEEAQIAAYLDEKSAGIDSLIEQTERSIDLLEEYRKSVITEAVTKGLDPDAPMKDSGIEWIGEIPQAWSAQPLKYITSSIESGRSVDGANCPANENEPGVLTLSSVYKASFNPQANKAVEDAESISLLRCPVKGESLLISRCNTSEWVGTAAIVEKDIPNLFLPDKIWQLGFSSWPLCRWIWYYLQSNYARHYFAVNSVGASSTMQNVSKDDLLALVIPVPPASEQDAILVHLDKEIAAISQSVATRRRLIEKLQEYRKSLIYEAVTGKFKVSGAE